MPEPTAFLSEAASEFSGRPLRHRSTLTVSYKLRLSDLYWMWETSPAGLCATAIFASLGLLFFSTLLNPSGAPVAHDVAIGILCVASAPFIGPAVMILASGKLALRGRKIELQIDALGLRGWSVPHFRETTWARLRHPRLESRVLVLPFSWPFADSWAVIPVRAFTPSQFSKLVTILEANGFLRDGDHRSLIGRLLGPVLDHRASSRTTPKDGHLARFPTFEERHVPFGRG